MIFNNACTITLASKERIKQWATTEIPTQSIQNGSTADFVPSPDDKANIDDTYGQTKYNTQSSTKAENPALPGYGPPLRHTASKSVANVYGYITIQGGGVKRCGSLTQSPPSSKFATDKAMQSFHCHQTKVKKSVSVPPDGPDGYQCRRKAAFRLSGKKGFHKGDKKRWSEKSMAIRKGFQHAERGCFVIPSKTKALSLWGGSIQLPSGGNAKTHETRAMDTPPNELKEEKPFHGCAKVVAPNQFSAPNVLKTSAFWVSMPFAQKGHRIGFGTSVRPNESLSHHMPFRSLLGRTAKPDPNAMKKRSQFPLTKSVGNGETSTEGRVGFHRISANHERKHTSNKSSIQDVFFLTVSLKQVIYATLYSSLSSTWNKGDGHRKRVAQSGKNHPERFSVTQGQTHKDKDEIENVRTKIVLPDCSLSVGHTFTNFSDTETGTEEGGHSRSQQRKPNGHSWIGKSSINDWPPRRVEGISGRKVFPLCHRPTAFIHTESTRRHSLGKSKDTLLYTPTPVAPGESNAFGRCEKALYVVNAMSQRSPQLFWESFADFYISKASKVDLNVNASVSRNSNSSFNRTWDMCARPSESNDETVAASNHENLWPYSNKIRSAAITSSKVLQQLTCDKKNHIEYHKHSQSHFSPTEGNDAFGVRWNCAVGLRTFVKGKWGDGNESDGRQNLCFKDGYSPKTLDIEGSYPWNAGVSTHPQRSKKVIFSQGEKARLLKAKKTIIANRPNGIWSGLPTSQPSEQQVESMKGDPGVMKAKYDREHLSSEKHPQPVASAFESKDRPRSSLAYNHGHSQLELYPVNWYMTGGRYRTKFSAAFTPASAKKHDKGWQVVEYNRRNGDDVRGYNSGGMEKPLHDDDTLTIICPYFNRREVIVTKMFGAWGSGKGKTDSSFKDNSTGSFGSSINNVDSRTPFETAQQGKPQQRWHTHMPRVERSEHLRICAFYDHQGVTIFTKLPFALVSLQPSYSCDSPYVWPQQHYQQPEANSTAFSHKRGRNTSTSSMVQFGEVDVADTLNYRTLKPVQGGLFCETLFGPIKDWECQCGRLTFTRAPKTELWCPNCLVQITRSVVRRVRMGYIQLAAPIMHIWYKKQYNNPLVQVLSLNAKTLTSVFDAKLLCVSSAESISCCTPSLSIFDFETWESEVSAFIRGEDCISDRFGPWNTFKLSSAQVCTIDGQRGQSVTSGAIETEGERKHQSSAKTKAAFSYLKDTSTYTFSQIVSRIERNEFLSYLQYKLSLLDAFGHSHESLLQKHIFAYFSNYKVANTHWHKTDGPRLNRNTVATSATKTQVLQKKKALLHCYTLIKRTFAHPDRREGTSKVKGNGYLKGGKAFEDLPLGRAFLKDRSPNALHLQWPTESENSNSGLHCMFLTRVPVLPPDLRPIVQVESGKFATSDVNDLYRFVIFRNNRLKRFLQQNVPEAIFYQELRLVQHSVDALFDNSKLKQPISRSPTYEVFEPLKSLSDRLAGKRGRFRQNLLGKRVDYSGRSVIVVGPKLRLFQCGLPIKMAFELFFPFLIQRVLLKALAKTTKNAKIFLRENPQKVRSILGNVIASHCVILNRAPTLHRMGVQAFFPTLVEGKAIQLHPLMCPSFNADFDGDQMAVHIPLRFQSQIESRFLMLSPHNWVSPADGDGIIGLSQDMILGFYYLTFASTYTKTFGNSFGNAPSGASLQTAKTTTYPPLPWGESGTHPERLYSKSKGNSSLDTQLQTPESVKAKLYHTPTAVPPSPQECTRFESKLHDKLWVDVDTYIAQHGSGKSALPQKHNRTYAITRSSGDQRFVSVIVSRTGWLYSMDATTVNFEDSFGQSRSLYMLTTIGRLIFNAYLLTKMSMA